MYFDSVYPTISPRPFSYISLKLHVHLTFHGVLSYTFYFYAFCAMYVQYTYAEFCTFFYFFRTDYFIS